MRLFVVHTALNLMEKKLHRIRSTRCAKVFELIGMERIFMSALTTVLGMLPLVVPLPVYSDGELDLECWSGSELSGTRSSCVRRNDACSTFFTLVLIPAGFSLVMDAKEVVAGSCFRAAAESWRLLCPKRGDVRQRLVGNIARDESRID